MRDVHYTIQKEEKHAFSYRPYSNHDIPIAKTEKNTLVTLKL